MKTYEDYKNYLFSKGYTNKLVTLDQTDKDEICEILEINKGIKCNTFFAINIKFHRETKIIITQKHLFKLNITDENKKEISDDTEIMIEKMEPSNDIYKLARIKYLDIKNGYKFDRNIEIQPHYHFCVYIINPKNNIPKENIKFEITFDYWRM